MDDDEKAALARQGMKAVEFAKPGEISRRVKGKVKGAAGNAALRGIAAIGRLTGATPERSPGRATAVAAVDFNNTLQHWNQSDADDFDAKLKAAVERPPLPPIDYAYAHPEVVEQAPEEDASEAHLEALRRSFPEDARKFAMLIFNCVDLLEELADDVEGNPPDVPDLERKEKMLTRIAELLQPQAGPALTAFVAHIVDLSRRSR